MTIEYTYEFYKADNKELNSFVQKTESYVKSLNANSTQSEIQRVINRLEKYSTLMAGHDVLEHIKGLVSRERVESVIESLEWDAELGIISTSNKEFLKYLTSLKKLNWYKMREDGTLVEFEWLEIVNAYNEFILDAEAKIWSACKSFFDDALYNQIYKNTDVSEYEKKYQRLVEKNMELKRNSPLAKTVYA